MQNGEAIDLLKEINGLCKLEIHLSVCVIVITCFWDCYHAYWKGYSKFYGAKAFHIKRWQSKLLARQT